MSKIRLGLLHSTIRGDEKLILQAARDRGVEVELVDIRTQIFNPETYRANFKVALERSVSTVKGNYAIRFLEAQGVKVVNSSAVASLCEDKFLTSLALQAQGVATPKFALVFTYEQAVAATEQLGGFPVILKPALGSWGRLLSKINDLDALETIIEHKEVLGGPQQKAFYFQQFVDKPGRDIRAFVIDGQVIAAIYRHSPHWITNTARGGQASNCPITPELAEICRQASQAVGGGILAMDVFEVGGGRRGQGTRNGRGGKTTQPAGFSINEINHTMEFKNSEAPTGVSISGAIVDYCIRLAKENEK